MIDPPPSPALTPSGGSVSGSASFTDSPDRSPLAPQPARTATFSISVQADDRMAWATWLTVLTVVVGILCAILGDIPVNLPMPTHAIHMVTPTCGLTRGTVAILRGHFSLAFHYNPMSFAVLPIAALGIARFIYGKVARRWVNVTLQPTRRVVVIACLAFVALGIYQQSHAMFIMESHAL